MDYGIAEEIESELESISDKLDLTNRTMERIARLLEEVHERWTNSSAGKFSPATGIVASRALKQLRNGIGNLQVCRREPSRFTEKPESVLGACNEIMDALSILLGYRIGVSIY